MEVSLMNIFFNVLMLFANFLLIAVLIGFLTFFMSLFFKKRSTLIASVIIVIFGTLFIVDQMQYTTFQKLVSDQLNEESIVESISITINDVSESGGLPVRVARVKIEDEEIIKRILQDFSDMELKKDVDARYTGRDYSVRILTTNEVKENFLETSSISLDLDDYYVNEYEIVNETDHLKTIELLVESDEIDWDYYE